MVTEGMWLPCHGPCHVMDQDSVPAITGANRMVLSKVLCVSAFFPY